MLIKRGRATRRDHVFGLYPHDEARFLKLREELEGKTGRPHSASAVFLFLMDRFDDLCRIDAVITKQAKKEKKAKRNGVSHAEENAALESSQEPHQPGSAE